MDAVNGNGNIGGSALLDATRVSPTQVGIAELLAEAKRDGVCVELIDGEPIIEAPKSKRHWLAKLRARKPEVLAYLTGEPNESDLTEVLGAGEEEPTPHSLRWQPFPVDALPEPWASYVVSVAASVRVDPVMVAMPALCASAAAIGASRAIQLTPDWQEPPILWGALIASSGEGKSPAAKAVYKPAQQRDREAQEFNSERLAEFEQHRREFESDRKTWEKLRAKGDLQPPPAEPERPPLPRFTVSDITIEKLAEVLADSPRGLLMIRDELTGLLGGFDRYSGGRGGAERSCYLSMFTAEVAQVDRKTGDRRSITLERPHLSIFGGVQPQLVHKVLSNDDLAAGLPARFLFAMPPETPKRWGTPRIPPEQTEQVAAMFRRLYAIGVPVEWSPEDQFTDSTDALQHEALPLTPEQPGPSCWRCAVGWP